MALKQEQVLTLKQRLEEAPVIETRVDNYGPFLDITKDNNPIHTNEEYTRNTPFGSLVVPGLYLVFKVEGHLPKDFIGIDLKFRAPVKPGDEIRFLKEAPSDGGYKINWYNMSGDSPELALVGKISMNPSSRQLAKILNEFEEGVKIFEGIAGKEDISLMMDMARFVGEPQQALNLHALGYVSRGLLSFSQENVVGAYANQRAVFHSRLYADEQFKVLARIAKSKKIKGKRFINLGYNLVGSDKRPVVTGTALVAEMKYHQ